MFGALQTIGLYVADQERALAFYTGTLGFEIRRKLPMAQGAFWVEVAPPGSDVCLAIYPRALVADWATMRPSLMFACADVGSLCEELERKGVTITLPPAELPFGIFAAFEDPDGNTIGITSPVPKPEEAPKPAFSGERFDVERMIREELLADA